MGFLTRSRKSASSSSSNTPYSTSPAASSASNSTTTVDSLSARIAKTLTWGSRPRSSDGNNSSSSNNNNSSSSKFPAPTSAAAPAPPTSSPKKSRKQPKKVHPSERELTEANLRHYEMLAGFRMEFGRTQRSRTSFDSDVSPMGSRMGSLDYGSGVGPFGERR